MKVILFMAISANGLIARDNGDEDFLSHTNWTSFSRMAKEIGCFIVGRKTYEAVQKWKDYNFNSIDAKKIIVSTKRDFQLEDGYILANSPVDAIENAKKAGFSTVILTGGSKLNSSFIKSDLVNEIILNIEPAVIGKGIALFSRDDFEARLKLKGSKELSSGIIQVRYEVLKQ